MEGYIHRSIQRQSRGIKTKFSTVKQDDHSEIIIIFSLFHIYPQGKYVDKATEENEICGKGENKGDRFSFIIV